MAKQCIKPYCIHLNESVMTLPSTDNAAIQSVVETIGWPNLLSRNSDNCMLQLAVVKRCRLWLIKYANNKNCKHSTTAMNATTTTTVESVVEVVQCSSSAETYIGIPAERPASYIRLAVLRSRAQHGGCWSLMCDWNATWPWPTTACRKFDFSRHRFYDARSSSAIIIIVIQ